MKVAVPAFVISADSRQSEASGQTRQGMGLQSSVHGIIDAHMTIPEIGQETHIQCLSSHLITCADGHTLYTHRPALVALTLVLMAQRWNS